MMHENSFTVEEKVASMFQPDTVLPAQYFETIHRKAHLEPEKRLMLEILEDAIASMRKHIFSRDRKGKTVFQEAEKWIMAKDESWLFSFDNICEVLGLSPDYVRRGLLKWKEDTLAEHPKAKIYRLIPRKKKQKQALNPHRKAG